MPSQRCRLLHSIFTFKVIFSISHPLSLPSLPTCCRRFKLSQTHFVPLHSLTVWLQRLCRSSSSRLEEGGGRNRSRVWIALSSSLSFTAWLIHSRSRAQREIRIGCTWDPRAPAIQPPPSTLCNPTYYNRLHHYLHICLPTIRQNLSRLNHRTKAWHLWIRWWWRLTAD